MSRLVIEAGKAGRHYWIDLWKYRASHLDVPDAVDRIENRGKNYTLEAGVAFNPYQNS